MAAGDRGLGAGHNGVHTLIVVTAGYHMKRALAELYRAACPAVTSVSGAGGYSRLRLHGAAALRLLAGEY